MDAGSKNSAISRRRFIQSSAAGTALAMNPALLSRAAQSELIMGTIPSTGEQIPAIGLRQFSQFFPACQK